MHSMSETFGEQSTWDVFRLPAGFHKQLDPPSKDSSPHAAVERVRRQPEQLVTRVGGQGVDQETQVHSYNSFTQQDVQLWLVFILSWT